MGCLTGAAPKATSLHIGSRAYSAYAYRAEHEPRALVQGPMNARGFLGRAIPRHAKGTWAGPPDSRSPPRSEPPARGPQKPAVSPAVLERSLRLQRRTPRKVQAFESFVVRSLQRWRLQGDVPRGFRRFRPLITANRSRRCAATTNRGSSRPPHSSRPALTPKVLPPPLTHLRVLVQIPLVEFLPLRACRGMPVRGARRHPQPPPTQSLQCPDS